MIVYPENHHYLVTLVREGEVVGVKCYEHSTACVADLSHRTSEEVTARVDCRVRRGCPACDPHGDRKTWLI